MNSPRDRFVPPREMDVERPTTPLDRFTTLRENDVGRFRECSSRNIDFFPRDKITPLNEKVLGKVIALRTNKNKLVFPRERAEGRFPRGGFRDRVVPLSKRRFFPKDRITPPKGRFPKTEDCRQLYFSKEECRGRIYSSSHAYFLRRWTQFSKVQNDVS